MFNGATSFNQNLCAWGKGASSFNLDNSIYDDVDDMFLNSGCTFRDEPNVRNKGPFCASDCSEPNPAPTPSPVIETVVEALVTGKPAAAPITQAPIVATIKETSAPTPSPVIATVDVTPSPIIPATPTPSPVIATNDETPSPVTPAPLKKTSSPTEALTEAVTEAATEATTQPETEAATEATTQPETEEIEETAPSSAALFSGGLVQMLVTSAVCVVAFI